MEKKKNNYFIIVSSLFLIAIITCLICDVLINKSFTWSLIVISAIILGWSILYPILKINNNKIAYSLLILTLLILPFLYILEKLLNVDKLFLIGTCISLVSLWYLWSIYLLFRVLKKRKTLVMGIAFLLGIPLELFIIVILVRFHIQETVSFTNYLSIIILFVLAIIFLVKDSVYQKMLNIKNRGYYD